MNFPHGRSVDDSLDIQQDAHFASVDSSDEGPDSYRADSKTSGHDVAAAIPLGSTHGAGAGSEEQLELGKMDQANTSPP